MTETVVPVASRFKRRGTCNGWELNRHTHTYFRFSVRYERQPTVVWTARVYVKDGRLVAELIAQSSIPE